MHSMYWMNLHDALQLELFAICFIRVICVSWDAYSRCVYYLSSAYVICVITEMVMEATEEHHVQGEEVYHGDN